MKKFHLLLIAIFFNQIQSSEINRKITLINHDYKYTKLVLCGSTWKIKELDDMICKIEREEKDKKIIYTKYSTKKNSQDWYKSEMAISNKFGDGTHYYMRDGDWCQSFDYINKYWKLVYEFEDLKEKYKLLLKSKL